MRAEHGDSERFWKAGPLMFGFGRSVLDLLLPPSSLDGEAALSGGLTASAFSKLTFLDDPVCDGCGLAMAYEQAERCPGCQAKPKAFQRCRAACVYDEHSRELILKLKHADRTDLAGLFARWLSRASVDLLAEGEAVVPVPVHRTRMLSRRYNQAAEIARPLARMAGLAYLPDVLIRKRDTDSQGGKSASGRRRNVAAAFAVPEARRHRVVGRRIVLIDDVLTTGATAEGCARALLAAGAASVTLSVVARVTEMQARPI
ncbi:ComF family protein [Caulobacter sp. FWC2]|uniref:ComF family protein n=1 Tax=Caulobacter sp. FWC2 TaxID=69664 RepID=UPI000C14ABFA|nr:ComF family protein [Caulobacter sp. FWC2]PIB93640.1 amidophosphoribosyltransferase [Caulobacter sp. FWC2]